MGADHRLLGKLYLRRVGIIGRIVYQHNFAVGFGYAIYYRRSGGDKVQVIFSFQSFLYYIHMEQPQKSASETESQSYRGFGVEGQRRIVKPKLFKSVP